MYMLRSDPFKCEIDIVPSELQLEVIELTSNDSLKMDFQKMLQR